MAIKRFIEIRIIEGDETLLTSSYANSITSGGVRCNADGVKLASFPITNEDLEVMHPKALGNIMEHLRSVQCPILGESRELKR